jgi:hypothetical protein
MSLSILSDGRLELLRETLFKVESLNDVVRDITKVKNDGDHVRLLTVIFFVLIVILDESSSVRDIARDVLEVSVVERVGEDDVVRNTLDGFLGRAGGVKNSGHIIADDLETIVFLKVLVLLD